MLKIVLNNGLRSEVIRFVLKLRRANLSGLSKSFWAKDGWLSVFSFVRSAPSARSLPESLYLQ